MPMILTHAWLRAHADSSPGQQPPLVRPARESKQMAGCRPARRSIGIACPFLCALLAFAGCGKGEDQSASTSQPQQQRAQGQASDGGPGQRPGGRPEQPPTPVAVKAAFEGSIASFYNTTATLEAEKQAEILARVSGVVQSLACEEGDQVSQGQQLLRIQNDEYMLRLRQAKATTANLQARFERMRQMRAEELVTEEEFETTKSDLAKAEAEEGLARLDVSYTTVMAPFSGKVVRRLVDVGQNVSVGTPLFSLADFDPLLARVHVPAKEFKKLAQDQPVELLLDSNRLRMEGRIKLISPIIDPASGTIKITVEIPSYPAGTRPGDFAEVQIVTERRAGATLVPKSAVINDKGEAVIYIAAGGTAERRVVETGFTDTENTEILAGLEPGENVVVKGQRSLKHGDPLKILDDALAESAAEGAADSTSALGEGS